MRKTLFMCLILCVAASVGCMRKPYPKPIYAEVKPNETCALVKLEGDTLTGQAKLASSDFLEQNRVQAKRIEIPQRWSQTGRYEHNGEWIPSAKLLCVDRSPVTREWTMGKDGSNTSNQAINCETKESINFGAGMTLTASVTDDGFAKFYDHFAGHNLSEIMDTNIRGSFIAQMCPVFGTMTLDDEYNWTVTTDKDGKTTRTRGELIAKGVRSEKGEVIAKAYSNVKAEYAKYGIAITNAASSQGLTYANQDIQKGIDKVFVALMDQDAAAAEKVATITRAEAHAQALIKDAEGQVLANNKLQASLTPAIIKMRFYDRWDGHLPRVQGGTNIVSVPME